MKQFAHIRPGKVFLRGTAGESISQTVQIVPGEEETFKILQVNALKGGDFDFSLKEAEINGKPGYELTVNNLRQTEGRYFDKIFMITDRTDQAPLNVMVSGQIQAPANPPAEPEATGSDQPQNPSSEPDTAID